jgi:GT2 family glycosyltransferase
MSSTKPVLSIIILSFNTKELLKNTLKSIPGNKNWQIIVVDNASNDRSVEMVASKFPHVQIIQNDKNLGFAAGNNIGIKQSSSKYIMLLNSDTEIVGNAIEDMLDYLDEHHETAIITPKVVLEDGAIDLACHRGMPTPWNAFTYFSQLERLFPNSKAFGGYHQTHKNFETTHHIEATAATAIIVRKSAIDKVGLLDERFFLYAEDLDWCKRMTDAGYQITYFPKATILHHKSQSGKKRTVKDKNHSSIKSDSHHHFYATMKQFYHKHYQDEYPRWIQKLVFMGIDLKQKITKKT